MLENQNWTSEFAHSFRNLKSLYHFLDWPLPGGLEAVAERFPLFIPKALAEKINAEGPEGVLAKEFLPSAFETDADLNRFGYLDPIGDEAHQKAPQLIHRYHSRALFTPTTVCPVHCRYCFRKNELAGKSELFQSDFEKTLSYLKEHPEIQELIFTGGDPLTLSNEKMASYLNAFLGIDSIKDIRFHTRYPVILPSRIDSDFLEIFERYSRSFRTLSIAIHANHKNEFDQESREAINKLSRTGIQLLSQTVLLRGVNDDSEALTGLIEQFIELKVRPYYLHHPDRVFGGMHFYLPLEEGRRIYQSLRSKLPGWALPHYVIDVPGGSGKTSAFNPESYHFKGEIISLSGDFVKLKEPDLFV